MVNDLPSMQQVAAMRDTKSDAYGLQSVLSYSHRTGRRLVRSGVSNMNYEPFAATQQEMNISEIPVQGDRWVLELSEQSGENSSSMRHYRSA